MAVDERSPLSSGISEERMKTGGYTRACDTEETVAVEAAKSALALGQNFKVNSARNECDWALSIRRWPEPAATEDTSQEGSPAARNL